MRNAQLDAEHLALGMLSIKDGMATKIFDFLGADVGEIKKDLEFSLKKPTFLNNSFVIIALGSFGIAEVGKVFGSKKDNTEEDKDNTQLK